MACLAVAVVFGVLALPVSAQAAEVFTVTATGDGTDRDVGDGACETAVAGQCTLRAALQEANATAAQDTIIVPSGTYVLTIPPSGDNGAGSGDLDVTAPVTINGAGSANTTVRVAGPPPGSPPEVLALDRLLELHPGARNATISGVTFRDGYDAVAGGAIANAATGIVRLTDVAVRDSFATDEGGGIHNLGSLVLDRVTIAGNETGGSGGGLFTSGGSVTIVGTAAAPSVISSNTAGSGGGIYDGGELSPAGLPSRLTIRHTTISDNHALDTGGGVLVDQEANLVVEDSRFDSNEADGGGGGLAVQQKASADLARVVFVANTSGGDGGGALSSTQGGFDGVDLDFTANRAGASLDPEPDGSGGGLFTDGGGAVDVRASSFVANTAASDGGGLFVDNFGSVEITDVVVRDNDAGGVGGGIENSGNNVTFRRLDVSDNHADESGGGIHSSGSGLLNVVDSEIHRNLAQTGGGLTNDADGGLVVRGTTIHENRARVGSAEESGLGGGIFVLGDAGISIENTTISGNQAQVRGGGLYSDSDAGLHVAHATIVNNSAPLASGVGGEIGSPNFPVYPSTSVIFRNTIIAGNLLSPSCSFALGSEGGNIDSGTSCYFQGPGDRTNTTPEYDALADNGGPTPTHALTETSIAVDSGVACLATDQRGVERPQNGKCDSGAYEWEGPFAPADTDLPDTFFDGGPVQDTEATSLFYFHGTDATTPAGLLQFECRLREFDPTDPPEVPDPTEPPDPELLFVPCPSPWQVPLVEEGDYRFEVRAIDRAGNPDPSPAVHDFTGGLDFTGPETFIDEKPPATGAGRSAIFTFSATDNVTPSAFLEFECRLDNTEPDAWLECTNPAVFSDLTVGSHRFDVRAVDGNDNIGPMESWTWDVGVPADDCDAANVALTPVADTLVDEGLPSTSFAAEPFALAVRSSQTQGDARTLVRFPITDDTPDCTLASATLRLHGDGDVGRTLEARPLAGGFSEATATWNVQPASGAPDATAVSGTGYRDWDVTDRVAAILDDTAPNFGWQIRDAVRNDPEGAAQSFHSRETPQEPGLETRPRLVLRFEPADGPPPPPPPAPPEPTGPPVSLVCGARVTESIRLANDLLGCLGEGLIIGAPNIVVDLDGHRITSGLALEPGEEDGLIAGIRNAGYENVTIRDGSVESFGYGVRLLGSTAYGVVHDLQLRGNVLAGVELFDADNGRVGSTIRDNDFTANGAGVQLMSGSEGSVVRLNDFLGNGGVAVLIQDSSDHLVEDNHMSGVVVDPLLDSDGGVHLLGGTDNEILRNTITDAGDAGLLVSAGSHRNRIEGNRVLRTSDSSIAIDDSDDNQVIDNVTHLSGGAAISLGNAHDSLVRGNDARFNPGGIELAGSDDNRVEANDVSGAGAAGITVEGGVGNEIVSNQANRTGATGIAVEGDAVDLAGNPIPGHVIQGNTANQNLGDGISVAAGGHRVVANNAHHNLGFGITAGEGADDGGGNRASGNGETEQCVNVVCAEPDPAVPVVPADTMAPETTITLAPTGGVSDTVSTRIEFSGSDNEAPPTALRFECRLDPGPDPTPEPPEPPEPGDPVDPVDPTDPNTWEECASPVLLSFLVPGPHVFQVRAIDPSDNRDYSHETVEFEVIASPTDPADDDEAPSVTIVEGPDDPTTATSATFRFRGSDNLTPGVHLRYECSIDGATFAPCTSPATFTGLAVAAHTFEVRAIDLRDNVSPPRGFDWVIQPLSADTSAPDTTIDSGPDPLVTDTDATVTFSSNEPDAGFECSLDGAAFAPCTSPMELADLTVDAHSFAVRAVDAAANVDATPATHEWEVLAQPVPTTVSCGQVITSSVLVRNDLTDCPADGLVVGASRIAIDLDGHTIDGIGLSAGIRNDGHDAVRIGNGSIAEFDSGVLLGAGTSANLVEDLRLDLNQLYGIELQNADQAGVGNTIRSNQMAGNATGIGLLTGTEQATVIDNAIGSSSGFGIELVDAASNTVETNTISGSSNAGVTAVGSPDNRIVDNELSGIADQAIVLEVGSHGSHLEANEIEGSEGGIYLAGSDDVTVVDNVTHGSSDNGLSLEAVHGGLVEGNDLRFNGGGVEISESSGLSIVDNDLGENGVGLEVGGSIDLTIARNQINGNDAGGLSIEGDAPFGQGILLDRNTANGNGGDGIAINGVGHTVRANTANTNSGWGIHGSEPSIAGSNVDAGGNNAVGNVELLQCYQITCNSLVVPPDRQAPDTTITSGPAEDSLVDRATFAFEGVDNARLDVTFQCSLDDAPFGPCTSPASFSGLGQGDHTFAVRAVDWALNADPSPATWSWSYAPPPAGVAPNTTILSGPDPSTVATSATFTFTSNEPDGTFACSLDGAAFSPCTSPATYTGLAVGDHRFEVRAVDLELLADATPAARDWVVGSAPTASTVTCGQVLTQSTLVLNDLLDCQGDGLVVGAHQVTIDLGGRTIDGIGQGAGVRNPGFDSVTIANGTVQDFDFGVAITAGAVDNVVTDVRATLNQDAGVDITGADGTLLRTSTLTGNVSGLRVTDSVGTVVRGNSISLNSGPAVHLLRGSSATVEGNALRDNSGPGVLLEGADANRIADNQIAGNDGGIEVGPDPAAAANTAVGNDIEGNRLTATGGVVLTAATDSTVVGNVIEQATATGIALEGSDDNVLLRNEIRFGTGGIDLAESSGNRIESNRVTSSSSGIAVESSSLRNTLVANVLSANDGEGIYVADSASAADRNVIERNTAIGNSGDGISVTGNGHRIEANLAYSNGAWGIFAAPGNVDGGGNLAAGNIEPAQCTGVVCTPGDFEVQGLPNTEFVLMPPNPSSSSAAVFTFTGTDDATEPANLGFQCRLDSEDPADWVDCENPYELTGLTNDEHTLEVRAVDGLENVDPTPATFDWVVALPAAGVAPDTTIVAKPPAASPLLEGVFTYTSNEVDVLFECSLDGSAFALCDSFFEFAFEDFEVGLHSFEVRARDFEGLVDPTPAEFTWRITGVLARVTDGPAFIAPSEPGEPAEGGEIASREASIEFTATDTESTFHCSLDFEAFAPCTSPFERTGLADGPHLFRVYAIDSEGIEQLEPTEYGWEIIPGPDVTPPETTIDVAPGDGTAEMTFEFSGSDIETPTIFITFECSIDGGTTWDECVSPFNLLTAYPELAPDEYTFLVRAVDVAEPDPNVDPTPAIHTWTSVADTVAPEVVALTGPTAPSAALEPVFTFSGTDNASPVELLTFECSLDGPLTEPTPFEVCTSPHQVQNLETGSNTLSVRATDLSGNTGTAVSWTWTVLGPPVVTITGGPTLDAAGQTTETTATFALASQPVGAEFQCALDGADLTPCGSATDPSVTFTDLGGGAHTLEVVGLLDGFASEPATFEWEVVAPPDTVAPDTTILDGPPVGTMSNLASFTLVADEPGVTFECALDGGSWSSCNATTTLTDIAIGSHSLLARATDAAGNVDASPDEWTWTRLGPPETTIDTEPLDPTEATSVSIEFSSPSAGPLTFECALDSGAFEPCTSPVTYTGLAPGEHAVFVRAVDPVLGTDPTPADVDWLIVPPTPPETSLSSGPDGVTTSTTASFAFTANEAGVTFECSLDGAAYQSCSTGVTYSGLSVGLHSFAVRGTDPGGTVDPSPATYAWTVQAPDTTPPETTLGSTPPPSTGSTAASFTFSATEAGSTFECSLDGVAPAPCISPVNLTGLAVGPHVFTVRARDAAGNADGSPASFSWTISPPPPNCGAQQVLTASADSWLEQSSPTSNKGTDSDLMVRSKSGSQNQRSIVRFTMPAAPAGCVVESATLRLFASASTSGRTIQALRVNATWAEGSVNWTNQPATTGTAATATSGTGWREWNVGGQLQQAYAAGAQHGFLLRDASENNGGPEQKYNSRSHGSNRPELVVRFGPGTPPPPDTTAPTTTITSPAPTGSSASIAFTANETGATFACSLDGGAFAPCTSPAAYPSVAPGGHTFAVRATDLAGNVGAPATQSWTATAPPVTCGAAVTVTANADSWITQGSTGSNNGNDSILKVRSKSQDANRAVVDFALPAAPAGCVVQSATLRLFADSARNGRTLQAQRLAATWSEGGITWANQPATTGPVATTSSGAGWRQWTVTSQVTAMYAPGADHGFLIRDANEGNDHEQSFFSREKGQNAPQLVIQFAPA